VRGGNGEFTKAGGTKRENVGIIKKKKKGQMKGGGKWMTKTFAEKKSREEQVGEGRNGEKNEHVSKLKKKEKGKKNFVGGVGESSTAQTSKKDH